MSLFKIWDKVNERYLTENIDDFRITPEGKITELEYCQYQSTGGDYWEHEREDLEPHFKEL